MRAAWLVAVLSVLGCEASVRVDDGEADEPQGAADPGWSIPPEQVFAQLYCVLPEPDVAVPMVSIAIWPRAPSSCEAPELGYLDRVLYIYILDWDFSSGQFVIGEPNPHGTALASWFPDQSPAQTEAASGTITIEPFDDLPQAVSWELDLAAGRADTSVCGTISKDFAVCVQPCDGGC